MSETIRKKSKLNIGNALFSSACILLLFLTVSVLENITPLGNRTFLMFDLKRQYVDYYSYLRTILGGKNNIFYSFSTALGSGAIGFYAYYLTSPFLVILSCFDREMMAVGVSIVICIKLMLAAFIMDVYLQKTVADIEKFSLLDTANLSVTIGAVSFSFSGYLFAYSMNMMWIDVIILLPLLLLAIELILDENRKLPFVFLLFYMLILNYYITYQVILFAVMWSVMRVVVRQDGKPLIKLARVLYSGILAGMLTAALLLPTAIQLMDGPKDIKKLGLEATKSNLSVIDVFSKLPTLSYDFDEIYFGFPQIYCGVLQVILVLLFFMSRNVSRREKIGMLSLFLILLVSFSFDRINLLWHAGMEPSGYPYRQAFLWVFIACICASRALLHIREEMTWIKLLVILAVLSAGAFLVSRGRYDHISHNTVLLNIVLVTVYSCYFTLLIRQNRLEKKYSIFKYLVTFMFVVNCADLTANAIYTYRMLAANSEDEPYFRHRVNSTSEAVKYVKDSDESFFRMEDLSPRQQNDGMMYNYNGITHYSSAGKIYVRYFLQRLGFNEDGLFTHYGHDNTAAADALLGIKYVLTDENHSAHIGYDKFYEGEESVYLNPHALAVAIGTDSFDISGISDVSVNMADSDMVHLPAGDPFLLQESIFGNLLGREVKIFVDADVKKSDLLQKEDKYYYDYEVAAAEDGELYFYLDGLIDAYENLSVYVDDEYLTTYGNASCVKVLNLGSRQEDERITVRVVGNSEKSKFGTARFVTENNIELAKICKEISRNNCSIKRISSSHLMAGTGDVRGVFLTIPYEKDWRVKVDGKKTEPVIVYDSLMYIPIDERGEKHIIDMEYVPVGIDAGACITVLGLLMLLIMWCMEKRQNKTTL